MPRYELMINGATHAVTADEDAPLLWVLREELGLTGTKFGCGKGLCGACTVHANGAPIRSCSFPVAAAVGQQLRTIESLGTGGELHPLQAAWLEHNVPQCGYCQAGQLMSAAALLAHNPAPDDQAIRDAMSGNICRCGTYPRIAAAIKSAAQMLRAHGAAAPKKDGVTP